MRFLTALILAWLILGTPFPSGNVADLTPVEILCLSRENGDVLAVCDGGVAARGQDVADAVENLHDAAPGRLFLGTVDTVVFANLTPEADALLEVGVRPAAGVYVTRDQTDDPDALAVYLRSRDSVTLGMLQEDANLAIPVLQKGETGLVLKDSAA